MCERFKVPGRPRDFNVAKFEKFIAMIAVFTFFSLFYLFTFIYFSKHFAMNNKNIHNTAFN